MELLPRRYLSCNVKGTEKTEFPNSALSAFSRSSESVFRSFSFSFFFVAELLGPKFGHRAAASRLGKTAWPIRGTERLASLLLGCADKLDLGGVNLTTTTR
jgi:hypothetical protein